MKLSVGQIHKWVNINKSITIIEIYGNQIIYKYIDGALEHSISKFDFLKSIDKQWFWNQQIKDVINE